LPDRETRLIVAPWPKAGDDAEAGALTGVQEAAEIFRRSGVRVPLEGDDLRIFEAVGRPRGGGGGDAPTEVERRAQGSERAGGGHARERALRAERTSGGRRRRTREARALPAGARCSHRLNMLNR